MRKDALHELSKFENSLSDMFPRLIDIQKDIEFMHEEVNNILLLKNYDFLERLQKKMSSYT